MVYSRCIDVNFWLSNPLQRGGRGSGLKPPEGDRYLLVILGLHWGYFGVALGLYWGYIGVIFGYIRVILGLHWGYVSIILWLC